MGGVRDELAARVIEPREPDPHAVEDGRVEPAARDPLRGALEPPDSDRKEARRPIADQQRDDQRQSAREEHPALDRIDIGERIVKRGRKQQDVAVSVSHRSRGLRKLAVIALDRPPFDVRRLCGARRNGVVRVVAQTAAGKRRQARSHQHRRLRSDDGHQQDACIRVRCRVGEEVRVVLVVPVLLRQELSGAIEIVQACVDQPAPQ